MERFTLKELRERQGLSQSELAIAMGTSGTTIGNWENNLTEPRISQFRQLAAFFKVPMESIEIDVRPKMAQKADRATLVRDFKAGFRQFYYTEWLKNHPFTFKLRSADASLGRAETDEWMIFNVGLPKRRVQWSLGLDEDDPWVAVSLQLRDEARTDINPLEAHRDEIERDLGLGRNELKFYRPENDPSNQYYISIETRQLNPLDREHWPQILSWICERADIAAAVFPRWIKRIHMV